MHHFCTQVYGDEARRTPDVPRELLVPELPADADALADWLSELRGSRVAMRVPQRGDKKTLHGDRRPQRRAGSDAAQAAPGR